MDVTTAIRLMLPDDRAFVLSAWSSSLRSSRDVPLIPMSMWASVMRPVLEHMLDRTTAGTLVAHGEVLQGFICVEPNYVLYLYVAQPFRRLGIARALLAAAGIDPAQRFGYACRTRASWQLLQVHRKAPLAAYDPFHVRFDNSEWSPE